MSVIMHERPGVYSSYDAASAIGGGRGVQVVGVAAVATAGTPNEAVPLHSYAQGLASFGADEADRPGMAALLRLLFLNGVSAVVAVAVGRERRSVSWCSAGQD